jgi:hypothetical protein
MSAYSIAAVTGGVAGFLASIAASPAITTILALSSLVTLGIGTGITLMDLFDDGLTDTFNLLGQEYNNLKLNSVSLKQNISQIKIQIDQYDGASKEGKEAILSFINSLSDGYPVNDIIDSGELLTSLQQQLEWTELSIDHIDKNFSDILSNYKIELNDFLKKKASKLFDDNYQSKFLDATNISLEYLDIDSINTTKEQVQNKFKYYEKISSNLSATTEEKKKANYAIKYLKQFQSVYNNIQYDINQYDSNKQSFSNVIKYGFNDKTTSENLKESEDNVNQTSQVLDQSQNTEYQLKTELAEAQKLVEELQKALEKTQDPGKNSSDDNKPMYYVPSTSNRSYTINQASTFSDTTVIEGDLGVDGGEVSTFSDAASIATSITGYVPTKSLLYIGITH